MDGPLPPRLGRFRLTPQGDIVAPHAPADGPRTAVRDKLLPLLRLFRAAVGREPAGAGLRPLLDARRGGASLAALAHGLLATAEGQALHGGPAGTADPAFARRAIAAASGSAGNAVLDPALAPALGLAPGLVGMARADALAALAETPLFTADPPALPALFGDRRPDDAEAYAYWQQWFEPNDPPAAASGLVIALSMHVGDTTMERAARTLRSLQEQSHPHWRLHLAGTVRSPWARAALQQMAGDARVTVAPAAPPPAGAAGALAAGDTLAPHALAHIAALLDADPAAGVVFTDEDVRDPQAGRILPRFKAAPSQDAMLAGDAIGQLAIYRTAVLDRLRAGDASLSGYDLALAACRSDIGAIRHLPRVLFHAAEPRADWPLLSPGPAPGPSPSPDAPSAWPRVPPPPAAGTLVSIILLTRDRPDLLRTVTDGVLRGTGHAPLELLIVDHQTTDPAAAALLGQLARDPRVRVLPHAGPFNFALMNNRAAAEAAGEVLLLLNNDVEVRHPAWLSEMAGHALRPGIGAVGARLLHRDGTLQHGGIVLGPEGRATHLYRGAALGDPGYLGQLAITRDVAAVTGACLAIRRAVYSAVGGMDESFPVTWNDIDLCQRVRRAGLRVLWTPHAALTHLEGETRGRDDDPARHAAFLADAARYRALWNEAADIDPFLNPNLIATETELCLAPPRLPFLR